jgi:hypothetical protein
MAGPGPVGIGTTPAPGKLSLSPPLRSASNHCKRLVARSADPPKAPPTALSASLHHRLNSNAYALPHDRWQSHAIQTVHRMNETERIDLRNMGGQDNKNQLEVGEAMTHPTRPAPVQLHRGNGQGLILRPRGIAPRCARQLRHPAKQTLGGTARRASPQPLPGCSARRRKDRAIDPGRRGPACRRNR